MKTSRNLASQIVIVSGLGLSLMLAACSKEAFVNTAPLANGESSISCLPGQTTVNIPTKILFIVDQSGSNALGNNQTRVGTDPVKSFRSGVISNFFNSHATQANLAWGFLSFSGTAATSLMPTTYFGGNANFSSALTTFAARADVGNTPYKAALQSAHTQIQQDLLTAPANQNYLISFLTDGYPSDYCPGSPAQTSCPGQIMDAQLLSDISSLVNLAPGRIQMGTVYYGPVDASAQTRLANMASTGGGQFVNANVTSNIDLNDVLTIPTQTCGNGN